MGDSCGIFTHVLRRAPKWFFFFEKTVCSNTMTFARMKIISFCNGRGREKIRRVMRKMGESCGIFTHAWEPLAHVVTTPFSLLPGWQNSKRAREFSNNNNNIGNFFTVVEFSRLDKWKQRVIGFIGTTFWNYVYGCVLWKTIFRKKKSDGYEVLFHFEHFGSKYLIWKNQYNFYLMIKCSQQKNS